MYFDLSFSQKCVAFYLDWKVNLRCGWMEEIYI